LSKKPELARGDNVAIALQPGVGIGFARDTDQWFVQTPDPLALLAELNDQTAPRWVWWDRSTATQIAQARVPIDRCWDVATVHRLIFGGWKTSVGEVWASLNGLPLDTLPRMGQLGLLDMPDDNGDRDSPIQPDGHLRPEWISGGSQTSVERLASWASLVLRAMRLQQPMLDALPDPDRAHSTARSESAAELLCAEMTTGGLPIDEEEALRLIGEFAGPRAASALDEERIREERDEEVLVHLTPRQPVNLRNPAEVKAMLRRQGHELPDTRAWRLEQLGDTDPLIPALLRWRKAERISTTYGYGWLDEHVRDGRLRGGWASSDGAAGRMTASAGLHNLPAAMRSLVKAEDGYVFVRADLGQIEPRVLASVSGDAALIAATLGDDLYEPIASRLGVTRDIAKVAVLGAMYGATTGESAHALAGLNKNYPVAMGLLEEAAEAGRKNQDVFTSGGRRVRMSSTTPGDGDLDRAVAAAAARGRYARNAIVQGSAAEFFKVWAITVRRRGRALAAEVVLCLHDELLVHARVEHASEVAALVADAIGEAAHYWSPDPNVRFSADVSVIKHWSEAK
jgi:DNA polymerase I